MWAVYRKELNSYFHSPIAYVLIGFFVLLTAIFFYPYVMALYGDFTPVLSTMGFILLFIVPILTMRISS